MNQILESIGGFFRPLSAAQKVLFGLFAVAIVATVGTLVYWSTRPNYALLFSSLSPKSAQSIVEELKKTSEPYELKDGGSSIFVPQKDVYNLRIQFASQGIANSDYKGYELFDNNNLGMTDFMQHVNMKRALEGELAKTISSIKQVQSTRVHLVLPERSPFSDNNVEASAAVIVEAKSGQHLTPSQIEGISDLVAGSVEDLTPDRVTILDQRGNKISDNVDNPALALSSAQLKVRQADESYLTQKGQSMLDQMLGAGNSILRVATDHDFEKLTRDSQTIDPDSRTVISEEDHQNSNNKVDGAPATTAPANVNGATAQAQAAGNRNNQQSSVSIKNYEVSTVHEQYQKPVGTIKRITATVLLNYKRTREKNAAGKDTVVYKPYTQAELNQVSASVKTALGMDETRGDQLTINQYHFEDDFTSESTPSPTYFTDTDSTNEWVRWGVLIAALAGIFYLLYSLVGKSSGAKTQMQLEGGQTGQLALNAHGQHALQQAQNAQFQNGTRQLAERNSGDEEEEDDSSSDSYRSKLSKEARKLFDMNSKEFMEVKGYIDENTMDATNIVKSMLLYESNEE